MKKNSGLPYDRSTLLKTFTYPFILEEKSRYTSLFFDNYSQTRLPTCKNKFKFIEITLFRNRSTPCI